MKNTIIFDCFGVLTTDTWRAFVDSLPPEIDVEKLRELNRQLDIGLLSHDDFKQQVFEISGAQPEEVERLLNNEVVKNDQLLSYIRDAKQVGIKIGLLSNISSDWITESFLSKDEQGLFDELILSHKVGLAKPDPKIFELACSRLGSLPEESIMIDDVERYCSVAESLGMAAVVYTDFVSFETEINKLLPKVV